MIEGTAGTAEDRDVGGTAAHVGWKLEDFAQQPQIKKAGLLLAELAGLRSYTCAAALYMLHPPSVALHENPHCSPQRPNVRALQPYAARPHQRRLRHHDARHQQRHHQALQADYKPCTVYRGVAGGVLPDQFWTPNEHGVMGGIELGVMSTTTDREVALMYMRQSDKAAKMVFEIRMGMIDRGADVSLLSQFPGEKEFLFAPLTGLEVASVPRVEGDVVVVELRLSCNLHDQTLEEVIGKMRTSHTAHEPT